MAEVPSDDPPTAPPPTRGELDEALRALNGQLVAIRLEEARQAATLKALVETLTAAGALPLRQFEHRRERELDVQKTALEQRPTVRIGEAIDKYACGNLPQIDCGALLPICKARCCTLTVVCSAQDLDERIVEWDYARPYELRRRADGYCAHSNPATRGCTIYERRPAVCRTYDCRNDTRIWRDFGKLIPAD
jgi:Fe-S-cluster containining protein